MINIMICGFGEEKAEELKREVNAAMRELSLEKKAMTSVVPMKVESCDGGGEPTSYLCIQTADNEEMFTAGRALTKRLGGTVIIRQTVESITRARGCSDPA